MRNGVLLVLALLVGCASGAFADEAFSVSYRSLGKVDVSFTDSKDGGSRTVFACATPEKARVLASKRRADLLGYGDLEAHGDAVTLKGVGTWTLKVEGATFVETFRPGACRLPAPCGEGAAGTGSDEQRQTDPSHPRWMDCFDAYGPSLWDIGGGQTFDLPDDFGWLKSLGVGFCGVRPSMERCVAPGRMDDTILGWQDAMARRYDMAYRHLLFPSEPLTLGWNRDPLPYVTPAEDFVIMPYYFNLGSMTHGQGLAVPVPQLDKQIFDIRYNLAKRMSADDSRLIGWHGCDEMGGASIHALMAVARTPSVVSAWKARHPDGGEVPDARDFLGWNPQTDLDLRGGWELKTSAGEWTPFPWNDPMLSVAQYYPYRAEFRSPKDLPEKRKTFLRRRFTLTGPKDARRYLHVARNRMRQASATTVNFVWTVRVNGVEAPMTDCLFSDCWDVGALLRDGENEIEINSWGQSIPGYVFLNGTRAVNYPHFSKPLNRRWHEAIEFITELKVEKVEGDVRAMRAGDPVRPLKLMATRQFLDYILPLCRKYGAYLHDTGLAGGCWAPMSGAGVAHSHGIPFSCEQGGPPRTGEAGVFDFRRTVTLYLNYANDAADFVFAIQNYRKNPFVKAWMEENLPLIHSIGKFVLPQQKIAVLRTSRQDRYGLDQHWNFDIARGPLQQLGRSFVYLESCDLADPALLDRYPVIFDCATLVMTEREAEAIRGYVERGGTFVAQHHTGLHTFEAENVRPLEKEMAGLASAAKARFIRLKADEWNDVKALEPIIDRLDIARDSRSNVWGTRMESKNGVYDLYLSSHVDAPHMKDGTNRIAVAASFSRESRPVFLRDFGAKGHPEVAVTWRDGAFAVPQATFEPYATRIYAAPSATPGRAALRWIRAQTAIWQEVASVPPPEPVESDPDFLALDEGWTMEANGVTHPVGKPQSFAALGLPDDATVTFRKTLQLPKDWCNRDLQFVFDAQGWYWGVAPKGELKVRGKGVSVDARFRESVVQTKAFDVRSEDGALEITLTVDGSKPSRRTPPGVTGVFYLRRMPVVAAEYPIDEAYACTDYGVRRPVKVGEKAPHRFFELRFPTPAASGRLYLRADGRLGGFFLNGCAVETRNAWMKVLDVTNLLRPRDQTNVLHWLPEKGIKYGAPVEPIEDALPRISLVTDTFPLADDFALSLRRTPNGDPVVVASSNAISRMERDCVTAYAFAAGSPVTSVVTRVTRDASGLRRYRIDVAVANGWHLETTGYPLIDVPYPLSGDGSDDRCVVGATVGGVWRPKEIEVGRSIVYPYPGSLAAQFCATWDKDTGFYFAAEDAVGYEKGLGIRRLKAGNRFVHERRGWDTGVVTGAYDVVAKIVRRTDEPLVWEDFADIYRVWLMKQPWMRKTYLERTDVPAWMKRAPAMTRYSRQWLAKPEQIGESLAWWKRTFGDNDVIAAVWGWEKVGTWWGPDYFPAFPNDETLKSETAMMRRAGFHPFAWPSCYNWSECIGRRADGSCRHDYRETYMKEASDFRCVTRAGEFHRNPAPWMDNGANAMICGGHPKARAWLRELCRGLAERGFDMIQFDQSPGGRLNDCWATTHGHRPGMGAWNFAAFMDSYREMAAGLKSVFPDGCICVEQPHEQFTGCSHLQDYRDVQDWTDSCVGVYNYLHHGYMPVFQSNPYRDNLFALAHMAVEGQVPFYKILDEDLRERRPALKNGGFETRSDNARMAALCWEVGGRMWLSWSPTPEKPIWDFEGAACWQGEPDWEDRHGGAVSYRMNAETKPEQCGQTVRDLAPGEYLLSAWVKTERLDGTGALLWGDTAGEKGRVAFPPAGTGWRKISAKVRADGKLRVILYAGVGVVAKVDDVELTHLDGTPVYERGESLYLRAMRAWIRLYQGEGRDFLAYGFREKPPRLTCGSFKMAGCARPTVVCAAYRSADGRRALAIANATDEAQSFDCSWRGQRLHRVLRPAEIVLVPKDE